MSSIYSIENNKNLFLYTNEDQICLRTSAGDSLTRPVILCNDFAQNLSDVIYNGTIYYAYQNLQQDIIIRSITDLNVLYKLSSQDTPDCFHPQITILNTELILFYLVKNPLDDSYSLKGLFPFQQNNTIDFGNNLTKKFASLPQLHLLTLNQGIILIAEAGDTELKLLIKSDLTVSPLSTNENLYVEQMNQLKAEHSAHLEEAKSNYLSQITTLNSTIAKRDKIIESIKAQYNELMDTATKYRDEAIKWRNKFYKED